MSYDHAISPVVAILVIAAMALGMAWLARRTADPNAGKPGHCGCGEPLPNGDPICVDCWQTQQW